MVHYCVKEGLLLAILWVDNQKEMVHYFVKEGLLLAIFCPFYCKKRVYYSLHFFLHKDYFGGILSKIGLRNALCIRKLITPSVYLVVLFLIHSIKLFIKHQPFARCIWSPILRPENGSQVDNILPYIWQREEFSFTSDRELSHTSDRENYLLHLTERIVSSFWQSWAEESKKRTLSSTGLSSPLLCRQQSTQKG